MAVERIWNRFLTEQDRRHVALHPKEPVGFGVRPALLLIDNYRQAIGDRPEPLLEATRTWPLSTGLMGWEALEHIRVLLDAARSTSIPVIHTTDLRPEESGVVPWARASARESTDDSPEAVERFERRYEFVDQAAPIEGEAIIRKSAPSAFFGTPLQAHLSGLRVDSLIVGGETTSGCVRATVVDAASYRYRVTVVAEAVYDRHEASHALSLFEMDRKYADVRGVDEVVAWLRTIA